MNIRFTCLFMLLNLGAWILPALAKEIPILAIPSADTREKWAASELSTFLREIYPNDTFPIVGSAPKTADYILLSSDARHPLIKAHIPREGLDEAGEFMVKYASSGQQTIGIIAGNSPRAVLDGVYSLLEQKLGHGFYLYRNAAESANAEVFDFKRWDLHARPLFSERVVYNWYNYLTTASTWNLPDYKHWIRQAARMRHTDVMLHSYGWQPFTQFTHNGVRKEVEYMQNSAVGRHWDIVHVDDVRKLIGGEVFAKEGPIFGADVEKVGFGGITDENRVAKTKEMLREVIDYAVNTVGLDFNWAIDVDTTYANPQNIILTLPESARFKVRNAWLPRPDIEEGYQYFRSMIQTMMTDFPATTKITLWSRNGRGGFAGGLTTAMTPDELPREWRVIHDAAPSETRTPFAPCHIYHAKVATAFRRALNELGYAHVKLGYGSWWREKSDGDMISDNFKASNQFMPPELTCYPLDYYMAFGKNPSFRKQLAQIAAKRNLVVIQWAHHDDGACLGRPFQPPADFGAKLKEIGASGFGTIHFMTRPLDLFFKNLQNQTWSNTLNEDLKKTCQTMALDFFGKPSSKIMAEYLYDWMTTAPQFGRESGPSLGGGSSLHDDTTDPKALDARARDCDRRIAILDRVDSAKLTPRALEAWKYFRGHEEWIKLFHLAQKDGNKDLRIQTIRKYVESASHDGGMTRGEKGILIQHNTKWLNIKPEDQKATNAN